MAITEEFKVKLSTDGAAARDEMGRFTAGAKAAQGSILDTSKNLDSLALKMTGVKAAFDLAKEAFSAIKDKIDELSAAYRAHEASHKLFLKSMEYSGNYTKTSAEALEAYAKAQQRVTGVEATTTLGLMAQAKAIGLTDEQTKKAISASANLAAARGMDIATAFNQVLNTVHGATDGLKDMVPALRHVNVEALAGGAAFKLIDDQFKGAAEEGGKTWQAYTARAHAAKEEIIASIGEVIDKGLDLTGVAKNQAEFWEKIAEKVEHFKSSGIAAFQAMRQGLTQVDWAGLGKKLAVVAGIITVAFGPTFAGIMAAALVAVSSFAATWLLVPAGVLATVAAIDLIARNLYKLPELGALFGAVFSRALLNVRVIFDQLLLAIIQGIEKLLSQIPGGDKLFGGLTDGLREMQVSLSDSIDKAQDGFKDLGTTISDTWGKLDTGLTGKAIEEVQKLSATVTGAFENMKKAAEAGKAGGNKGAGQKVTGVEVIPPEVEIAHRQFRQGIMAGNQAALEMLKIGKTEAEQLHAETEQQIEQLNKAAEILKTKGRGLTPEQVKMQGEAINKIRQAAAAKELEITKQAVHDGAALYGAQTDNVTQAIERQLADTTKALDEAARRDMAHWQQYQDAKVEAAAKAQQEIADKAPVSEKVVSAAKAIGSAATAVVGGTADSEAKVSDAGAKAWMAASAVFQSTVNTFMDGAEMMGAAIGTLVDDVLSGKFIDSLTGTLDQVGHLPQEIMKVFQNLGAMLDNIIKSLPGALEKFLQQLPKMLQKIMAELPKVLTMIIDALPKIAKAISDALPGLLQAILDKLPALIDGIVAAIEKMMDHIPEMFTMILKKLPEIIQHLVAGIADIITKIIDQLPAIFGAIADNIAPIVSSLIQAIIDAIPKIVVAIVKAIPGLVAAIFKIFINLIIGIVQGIARGLADVLSGKGFHFKMPDMEEAGGKMATGFKKAMNKMATSSSDLFKVEDSKVATKAADIEQRLADAAKQAAATVAGATESAWHRFEAALKRAWQWVYDNTIAPIEHLVQRAWQWVDDHVIQPIVTVVQKAWQWVSDNIINPILDVGKKSFQWVEDHVVTPLMTAGKAGFAWVEDHIVTPLVDIGKKSFAWVEDHIITPLVSAGKASFAWVEDHIVTPLQSIGKGAFQWVEDKIVKPLTGIGKGAFQWVEDHIVTPINNAFSKITGFKFPQFKWPDLKWPDFPELKIEKPNWLSGGGLVASRDGALGKVASGGSAAVSNIGSVLSGHKHILARGGMVRGGVLYAATGTEVHGTDTVPAMLTPGEFVVNRHAVSRVGLPALNSINAGNPPGGGGVTISAPISITTTQPVDDNFIRNRLVPALMGAIKKQSTEGKFTIALAGVRSV